MTQQFTDIMVDVETTGKKADLASIVQIGARKFNIKTGEVDTEGFKQSLTELPGRVREEGTMMWWETKVPLAIRKEVFDNPTDATVILEVFAKWCYPAGSLRMWAKPSHFDYGFVESHMKQVGWKNPFHYRAVTDMNSFIRGLYKMGDIPEVEFVDPAAKGGAHDALNDVDSQINYLLAHYQNVVNA